MIAGRNHDYGQFVIHQRVGTVLQFARRITLGVGVGNFLELERSLAGDRVMHSAAEGRRNFSALKCTPPNSSARPSQIASFSSMAAGRRIRRCKYERVTSEVIRPRLRARNSAIRYKNRELGGETFGRGNRQFRSSAGDQRRAGLTHDRCVGHVRDGDSLHASGQCLALRRNACRPSRLIA